ncbi:hypothetical protein ACSBR2_036984 [Camellia fascicularis]
MPTATPFTIVTELINMYGVKLEIRESRETEPITGGMLWRDHHARPLRRKRNKCENVSAKMGLRFLVGRNIFEGEPEPITGVPEPGHHQMAGTDEAMEMFQM